VAGRVRLVAAPNGRVGLPANNLHKGIAARSLDEGRYWHLRILRNVARGFLCFLCIYVAEMCEYSTAHTLDACFCACMGLRVCVCARMCFCLCCRMRAYWIACVCVL